MTDVVESAERLTRPLPLALKLVAWLFLLYGALAVVEVVGALLNGGLSVNLGVLGLWIGPGLLRLRPVWRTWALVFTWVGLVAVGLAAIALLAGSEPLELRRFGTSHGPVLRAWAGLVVAVELLLNLGQLYVLTRRDVRARFEPVAA